MCNDSDSMEEDIESLPQSDIEKLLESRKPKKLTADEIKMKRTYTYDPEPIKAWREINDYVAIKECNDNLWSKICNKLGLVEQFGFYNSHCLYRNRNSHVIHKIERILCPKQCYYLPEKCLLSHGYDFKNLLKRSLHDRFNPGFEQLFDKSKTKKAVLERLSYGPPNMIKLAEDIGINTLLEYDNNGMVNIDFDVLNENFWNDETPVFVKEETSTGAISSGRTMQI